VADIDAVQQRDHLQRGQLEASAAHRTKFIGAMMRKDRQPAAIGPHPLASKSLTSLWLPMRHGDRGPCAVDA
jgi:hypothetical protein